MLDKQGFFRIELLAAKRVINDCKRDGWEVLTLPEGITSRDDFFNGVRTALPLDPGLQSNRSWDALADSLWSGLHEALGGQNILVVWPNSLSMEKQCPEDFAIARGVFEQIADTIADPKYTGGGPTKRLLVLQTF